MKRLSTLFYTILLTGSAFAQIPNAGFETWTHSTSGGGYDTPDQWGNPNSYVALVLGPYSVQEGSPGYMGAHYAKLISQTVTGYGVVPGLVGTGTASLVGTTVNITGGFVYTSRPSVLTGAWQYAPSATDSSHIIIYLFKWNTATSREDTVAFTDKILTGSVTTWTPFSISLNYYSGSVPDSARIVMSSSKLPPGTAVAGSYLYVDTLAFAGTVPAGVITIKNNAAPTIIYPNPTTGNTSVFYYSVQGGNVTMNIYDLTGKKLKEVKLIAGAGENTFPVNVSGLAHGMYVLSITDELGGVEEKKLVVE